MVRGKHAWQFRQAAGLVDQIIKGARAGDIPTKQPITFEFVINPKTARALGLEVPPRLLTRADDVIDLSACFCLGPDPRITSGPAAIPAASRQKPAAPNQMEAAL